MGKKNRKKGDDSEDITKELEEMTLEKEPGAAGQLAKANGVKPKPNSKDAKSKKEVAVGGGGDSSSEEKVIEQEEQEEEVVLHSSKFGGLAAIADDDDDMMVDLGDDDDDDDDSDSDVEPLPKPTKKQLPPAPSKQNKKAKGKKAVVDDEEDWDALLTPTVVQQNQNNKKGKKEKKKAKKNKQEELDGEDDFDKLLEEARLIDGVTTSLQQEETEVVETQTKKKKKRKGKGDIEEITESNGQAAAPCEEATDATSLAGDAAATDDATTDDVVATDDADVATDDADVVATDDAAAEDDADKDDDDAAVEDDADRDDDDAAVEDDADKDDDAAVEDDADKDDDDAVAVEDNAAADDDDAAAAADKYVADTAAAQVKQSGSMRPKSGEGEDTPPSEDVADQTSKKSKKQKKKEADEERKRKKQEEEEKIEEKKRAKKGVPNKKLLAAMKELQQKNKEEDDRRRMEEEQLEKLDEERIEQEIEQKRLDEEKKERKKQKERERKEKLKAEGKLLTAKQRADQRRAQEMLEHLKAKGINVPEIGAEKKAPRLGSKAHIKKKQQQQQQQQHAKSEEKDIVEEVVATEQEKASSEERTKNEADSVKESWDVSSEEEEDEEEEEQSSSTQLKSSKDGDDTDNQQSNSGTPESSEESEEDEPMTPREKIKSRILKRKAKHEKELDIDVLRAPVVCVLGHVDHGKTKILDKLRRTNVQEGEVGGITQQIGATNVPSSAIHTMTKMIKTFCVDELKFPGLLIIDTPGHESFSNLRNRGSSLCDIAILVVDITQGLEPQTLESIGLLKKRKTPFVVALNKVDRIFEWESNQHKDIREVINVQKESPSRDFERRVSDIIVKLNEQGLNAALYYENPDARSYVSLIPTSAITGDGMGNLIAIICEMCQTKLAAQLRFSNELQCIVLEVKTIQGHGTTIDVILVNGKLREGDTIVLAGTDGPITTQIRSLLLPKPLKEIRVKGSYDEHKEITAAQGVKIAAKDLDRAIAGLSLRVAHNDDELELLREAVDRDYSQAIKAIKVKDKGVYVQASTLGAMEALLEFFKTKSIPYCGIRVGPVVKKDVMKAAAMLEHDEKYAVILAFDVRVEKDAQDLADKEGVKIFFEETIYHLGDRYVSYLDDYKKKQQEENRNLAIFPCKLKVLPTDVFNKRDPIIMGVTVMSGRLRTGTVLCVPGKEFVELGVVTSMEYDHRVVDIAKQGVDVCIKIFPSQGTTPKLFGRHFDDQDEIVSKISRESINACKEHFRDDLTKADWKLMAELKKLYDIL